MRLTSTLGGWAREGNTWLVLLALMLGVVLPAACVIWFMTAAASNEADAARQRLTDSLRGQLQLLSDRVDADWRSRLARLNGVGGNGAKAFHRAVTSGKLELDSIVFLARNGMAGYPIVVAPEQNASAADTGTDWKAAAALEASGSYAAAATQYADIAARGRVADRAALAARSHIRALVKARDSSGALQAIERYSRIPRVAAGRDGYGRLIIADERLLALRLLSPTDARFHASAKALATMVNDYDSVVMPSSQRLFLMGELRAAVPELSLPTYAAEQLAAEFLEADASAPAVQALESARIPDVWKLPIGSHAVALFRTATVTAMAGAVLRGHSVVNGATFTLTPPGHERGGESMPAGPLLRGWQLRVSLGDTDRLERTTNQRLYLSAGTLAVAALAVAGLLLWQAFRRQMRVSRLKTDLVAAVSHELRTPLTSARALVDLLLENPAIDGQTREYLLMIAGENARLTRLIEHVLTFARVDRKSQGLVFRHVSPAAVVREAAAAQGGARFPGLTIDVAPDLAPLYGDEDALVTVLLNLLENAYKYSDDDRRVFLRVRQDASRVVMEVEDNGIGIARRDWKRIFRPFYQVDQRLARERGGCGLGLSIVDFIVRAHGGQVTVDSEPGAGSLFRVHLPSRIPQREEAA